MPLVGLINSRGAKVPFDAIAPTYKLEDWLIPQELTAGRTAHWPLPLLLALARQRAPRTRWVCSACGHEPATVPLDELCRARMDTGAICHAPLEKHPIDSVWVTSLLQAPRREVLKRREHYFAKPERLVAMFDGGAFGQALERKCAGIDGLEAERRVTKEYTIDGETVEVSGRIDVTHGKALFEYKRMNVYALRKTVENGLEAEHEDYADQARFYGALAAECGIKVEPPYCVWVWASNWQKQYRKKEQDPQFAEFWVMPQGDEMKRIEGALAYYLKCRKEPEDRMPICEDREAFGLLKNGKPRRCSDYCEVNEFCSWWRENGRGR